MKPVLKRAVADLKKGRPIILVDDPRRENEGDLVMAAEFASPEWINFMASRGRGLICVAAAPVILDRLDIPKMVPGSTGGSAFESPFTVSVEAAKGITTGISAADRSLTIQTLADPEATPKDIRVPGHIFPLRAQPDGLRNRRGHTEASVELMKMAGLQPAAAICEIMNEDGTMARLANLKRFAATHDLVLLRISDIVAELGLGDLLNTSHPESPSSIRRAAESTLPTKYGPFRIIGYFDDRGREHIALVKGDPEPGVPVKVRMHSECLTGEVFGSLRCDCSDQLDQAMHEIELAGLGVIVYLRQEGRGIGLVNKIRAYALQDDGLDTVDANRCLGFTDDARTYRAGADILLDLGVDHVLLMTNNPHKISALRDTGLKHISRHPIQTKWTQENSHYLSTKMSRMNHLIEVS